MARPKDDEVRFTRTSKNSMKIEVGKGREAQAGITQLMRAMMGEDPLPVCKTCGGITEGSVQKNALCVCGEPA